jgi:hypothetical protein
MSDAAVSESGARQPRSGSGAKRKQHIAEQLERSLAEGLMPAFCNHCGEIETPTWRKAYTRVEDGVPTGICVSAEGNSIVGYEVLEAAENESGQPKYRIFKQALDKAEKEAGSFTQLNLCNREFYMMPLSSPTDSSLSVWPMVDQEERNAASRALD